MARRLIRITKEHIKDGECGQGNSCPIALALKPLLGFDFDWVEERKVTLKDGCSITLPPRARLFIEKFDKKKKVKPFNF